MEAALPAFFCPRPLPSCFVRPLAAARPPRRYSENTMNSRLLSGDSGAEAGQIIATTISGRNGLPKQPVSYIAERVVGTGSFGVVFQAKCLETGEAGEFFYSARRSVLAQQRQLEANQFGQNSLESPFLEQVLFLFCSFHTVHLHSGQDLITSMLQVHGSRCYQDHAKGRACQRRCSFPFLVRWVYSMQSMSIADSGELLKVDEEGAATTVIRLVHIDALLGVTRSPAQLLTPRSFNIFFCFWCITFRVFLSHFIVFAW